MKSFSERLLTEVYSTRGGRGVFFVDGSKDPRPHCENCDRITEFLFDGFLEPKPPPAFRSNAKLVHLDGTVFNERLVSALSAPFQHIPAKVCMKCRPLSNIEFEEMMEQLKSEHRRS